MKKKISKIILGVIVSLLLSAPSMAAEAIFQPSEINAAPGKQFSVSVYIDSQGTDNYVEKLKINYPADIIQVNSFSFDSTWIPLSQPGYDLIDNKSGTLVKSAGYPGGFSSPVPFGTISFLAKKEGSGKISVGEESIAFEISKQSAISGLPASVVITGPAVDVSDEILEGNSPNNLETEPGNRQEDESPTEEQKIEEADFTGDISQSSFMGMIGNILTLGTDNKLVGFAVALLLVGMIVYGAFFAKKKIKK